jgi:aminoglycoside phosphotransferase (APT) family kinase protein
VPPPAEQELIAHDPALPAMATVLDQAALTAFVAERWSLAGCGPPPEQVLVRYLRYKPGTALVAGLELRGPAGTTMAAAKATAARAAPKLAKTLRAVKRSGGWGIVDASASLTVHAAVADRHLPGLRRVLGGGAPAVQGLRYKPERRWVGRRGPSPAVVAPVLVKVHRPAAAAGAILAHRYMAAAGLAVPRLRKANARLGIVAADWVEGEPLDAHPPTPDQLGQVGELLGRLHALPLPAGLPVPDPAAGLLAAAEAVASVRPATGAHAAAAARSLLVQTETGHRRTVVHGDFSADQVVLGPGGAVVLLDLDRLRIGDPIDDVAGWVAAEITGGRCLARARPADVAAAMLAGYQVPASVPTGRPLDLAVAAALLRRAVEPFRLRRPGWPDEVDLTVELAVQLAAGRRP